MNSDDTPRQCSRCGERVAGPGGILCPECTDTIAARDVAAWYPEPAE
jgi:hypothetical protein